MGIDYEGMQAAAQSATTKGCGRDRGAKITGSLLGWVGLAGPVYLITSVSQGLLRPGFDFARHDWSLLANGSLGWIQMLNLVLTGCMVIAGAIGVRRVVGTESRARRWMPRLLGAYGVGYLLAGIFTADPADGFPIGTPAGRATTTTWHALAHLVAGSIGFICLVAACLMMASIHRRAGETRRAGVDTGVAIVFGLSFLGIASGSTSPLIVLGFTTGVVLSFGWLTLTAIELGATGRPDRQNPT